MALLDLNRAQGPQVATLKLASITPINWHRFPPRVASMVDANPNDAKPRYSGAGAAADWQGNAWGDDVDQAKANVVKVDANGTTIPDYTPRTEADRATQMGTTLAKDVTRRRGSIGPSQRYPVAGDTPLAAPVITSLSPNTAVAGVTGTGLIVDIIGTGFSVWSEVSSGNYPIPSRYISPTQIRIAQFPQNSVAGTVQVVVTDHGVRSAPSNFVFT